MKITKVAAAAFGLMIGLAQAYMLTTDRWHVALVLEFLAASAVDRLPNLTVNEEVSHR